MELKQFIKETIVQISMGMKEVITMNEELGIIVNPNITIASSHENFHVPTDPENISKLERRVQLLHYDIALTISEEDNIEIGGKVGIQLLGIKGHESGISKNTQENRLNFSIPICLPISDIRKS
jgi:hypothetical protein